MLSAIQVFSYPVLNEATPTHYLTGLTTSLSLVLHLANDHANRLCCINSNHSALKHMTVLAAVCHQYYIENVHCKPNS